MLALIAAKTKNNVIGINNTLPWKQKNDLQRFKSLTIGHDIMMGRKTFESFGSKPLPDRTHWIISRDYNGFLAMQAGLTDEQASRVFHMHHFEYFLKHGLEKTEHGFVIGGEQIYRQTMPIADILYITELDVELDGDAFFPEIDPSQWKLVAQEAYKADEHNQYDYKFLTYKRIAP